MLRIGWYARDGVVDLFPRIARSLADLGCPAESSYVCHHGVDKARLRHDHGIASPAVIAEFLRNTRVDLSKAAAARLDGMLGPMPVARALWSERCLRNPSAEQLLQHLIGHIEFWRRFLQQKRIDLLVAERPSILSTCIAWLVCHQLGIRYVDFIDLPLDRRMVISSSWEGYFDGFERRLSELSNVLWRPEPRTVQYLQRMKTRPTKTWEAQIALKRSQRVGRVNWTAARTAILNPWRSWVRAKRRSEYYLDEPPLKLVAKAARDYGRAWRTRVSSVFDSTSRDDDRFLLVPLHTDGEWSHYAWMGLGYADQVEFVRQVARCLPPGLCVYVKEHGSAYGRRPLSFYRALREIPAVKVVHPFADTFDLIQRCTAVVTLGSTLGFEACLFGKPVIVVGRPWYVPIPGVHRAETPEALAELIARVGQVACTSESEQLRAVQALFDISFEAVKHPHPDTLSEPNIQCLAVALRDRVRVGGSISGETEVHGLAL